MLTYRPVGLYPCKMNAPKPASSENTREKIICSAAEEILLTGFQAASINNIINKAGVSKGCFYHHFPTKQHLGYAVLDEMFTQVKTEIWEPIFTNANTLQAIINLYTEPDKTLDCEHVKHGCPINNLAQEMSPIDEGFRARIEEIYTSWKQRLTDELQKCQQHGYMNNTVEASDIATLIIAVTQGATGIAKNAQNPTSFIEYTHGLCNYLKSLQQIPS